MGSYRIRADETELASLVSRAEAGEEIVLSRDGHAVAKIIRFPESSSAAELEETLHRKKVNVGNTPGEVYLPGTLDEIPSGGETRLIQRRGGQNFSGLAGTDLSWLDEPLPEDIQRAFGMMD